MELLNESEGYLFVLARKIPDHLRSALTDKKRIVKGFANPKKTLKN